MTTPWPDLALPTLPATTTALHLWSQIVGKLRLAALPWLNHSWHVPLYVSARGLTTGLIPATPRAFELEFDLHASTLVLRAADGPRRTDTGRDDTGRDDTERHVPLRPQSVAAFHAATLAALHALDLPARITPTPCELPDPTPFPADHAERPYDPAAARAYHRALVQSARVFGAFRTRFTGKCSPLHLFWGGFDLAQTRFSGRPAPRHAGGVPHMPAAVAREAYSHEVSSAGFWPGGGAVPGPHFYSYAYPAPPGYAATPVHPAAARFDPTLGEFLLPYAAVATAPDPDATLLAFLQSTYDAAADLARWDRAALERPTGPIGHPLPDA